MVVGDTITCKVEKVVYGGDGLARVDGCVVFLPGTAAGETVRGCVTVAKKSFSRAHVLEVLESSPDRLVTPECFSGGKQVPGCVYGHLRTEAELAAKQEQLVHFLYRLIPHAETQAGETGATVFLPPVEAPCSLHYRNKITLHVQRAEGELRLGYRMEPEHEVLDMPACPLADAAINRTLAAFRASPAFSGLQDDEELVFRSTVKDGVTVFKYPPSKRMRRPSRKPMFWNPETGMFRDGRVPVLTESTPGGDFRVPADGFFQVNPAMGAVLAETLASWFGEEPETYPEVLDLYCGVGVFGLLCRKAGGQRLVGVEASLRSIEAARENAAAWQMGAFFTCVSLGGAKRLRANWLHDPSRTTGIVDPPRGGLAPNVVDALLAARLPRLFYVSCDPATLARDLQRLTGGGYAITRVRLFNLFPRTARFETLVELRLASAPGACH